MAIDYLNQIMFDALNPEYGPDSLANLIHLWLVDVGVAWWDVAAMREYLVDEESSLEDLSTNEMLLTYFRDFYAP